MTDIHIDPKDFADFVNKQDENIKANVQECGSIEIVYQGTPTNEAGICHNCIHKNNTHCELKSDSIFNPNIETNPAVECTDWELK